MQISKKDWNNYIKMLSQLNDTAGQMMRDYIAKNGYEDTEAIVDYAYGLVTKYGEGSAALAAEMYDETARLSGKTLPPAEVADTASYGDVKTAINTVAKRSINASSYGNTVSRFVKRAGADTTIQNAVRDGAEYAWIPSGDSCPLCIAIASRGFQHISRKSMRKGHAEHIHSNCDCNYTVRFDSSSGVEGYDPDEYLQMYESADGNNARAKINAMRRAQYQDPERHERILAQKRAAYAANQEAKRIIKDEASASNIIDVTAEYIKNAKPNKGVCFKDPLFEDKNGEEAKAEWLYSTFGGDLTLLPENNPEGIANPDYLWNNKLWDLKIPQSANGVDKRTQHGIHQILTNPGGIVIDISKLDMAESEIERLIEKRVRTSAKFDMDVIICNGQKLIKVLRHKK